MKMKTINEFIQNLGLELDNTIYNDVLKLYTEQFGFNNNRYSGGVYGAIDIEASKWIYDLIKSGGDLCNYNLEENLCYTMLYKNDKGEYVSDLEGYDYGDNGYDPDYVRYEVTIDNETIEYDILLSTGDPNLALAYIINVLWERYVEGLHDAKRRIIIEVQKTEYIEVQLSVDEYDAIEDMDDYLQEVEAAYRMGEYDNCPIVDEILHNVNVEWDER
jgi:hypothetical protein